MNETTLYLSQLMGPILVLFGISFLIKEKWYLEVFKGLHKNGLFLYLDSVVETTAGLAIVLSHNLWGTTPEVMISLIGWAMLFEGTMIMMTSKAFLRSMMTMIATSNWLKVSAFLSLVIGGYLSWAGYLA